MEICYEHRSAVLIIPLAPSGAHNMRLYTTQPLWFSLFSMPGSVTKVALNCYLYNVHLQWKSEQLTRLTQSMQSTQQMQEKYQEKCDNVHYYDIMAAMPCENVWMPWCPKAPMLQCTKIVQCFEVRIIWNNIMFCHVRENTHVPRHLYYDMLKSNANLVFHKSTGLSSAMLLVAAGCAVMANPRGSTADDGRG